MATSASQDSDIPPQASCFVRDYSNETEEAAVCLQGEGLLIYCQGRVIDWCNVGEETATKIALFYTYQPVRKHYVLQFPSAVKVVSKGKQLEVTHNFEGVVKFEISDFKNEGAPQLALWQEKCAAPQIVNLSILSSATTTNPIENILSSKLQGLKVSVAKLRHQVDEKKKLRKLHSFSFFKTQQDDPCQPNAQLVPLFGNHHKENICGNSLPSYLEVKGSWQRILCGQWVIGCDVVNLGPSPLRCLGLCVRGPPVTWRVMVCGAGPGWAWDSWRALPPEAELLPAASASIVGVVPEPSFIHNKPFIELCGMIRATLPDGRDITASIPSWRLAADAVLSGAIHPFASGPGSHEDLLACQAASRYQGTLRCEGRVGLLQRVLEVLQDASLEPPQPTSPSESQREATLLVGRGAKDVPLHGALLVLRAEAATSCRLELHLRDPRHLFLLVHRLRDGLPVHTRISIMGEDGAVKGDTRQLQRDLLEALHAEVSALTTTSTSSSLASLPPARLTLAPLELATDRAAQRLRRES